MIEWNAWLDDVPYLETCCLHPRYRRLQLQRDCSIMHKENWHMFPPIWYIPRRPSASLQLCAGWSRQFKAILSVRRHLECRLDRDQIARCGLVTCVGKPPRGRIWVPNVRPPPPPHHHQMAIELCAKCTSPSTMGSAHPQGSVLQPM